MHHITVAITGASGAIYARQLMDALRRMPAEVEVAVVFSACGEEVFRHELGDACFRSYAGLFRRYANDDFHAPFASGSAAADTMIIIPCSMGTLARIANGLGSDLLARAADVMLKERRRLIVVPREAPLNRIHLQNMLHLTDAGGIICPASPSFYHHPATVEEAAATVVDRVLQLAGLPHSGKRWND
ncbi:MAG: UbiX family flavin prenyltransferase [Prevotellaceae bacterium]|jgi:4-hydroxy-3-polyprenylbenzoate decarboxylase|nr:UbiX family flavin prenyltransferase [Prevotellaceae bacterium]